MNIQPGKIIKSTNADTINKNLGDCALTSTSCQHLTFSCRVKEYVVFCKRNSLLVEQTLSCLTISAKGTGVNFNPLHYLLTNTCTSKSTNCSGSWFKFINLNQIWPNDRNKYHLCNSVAGLNFEIFTTPIPT